MNVPRQPTVQAYHAMDRAEREAMREHNAFGVRHCRWEVPGQ